MITFIDEVLRHRPLGALAEGLWLEGVGVHSARGYGALPSLQVVWVCPLSSLGCPTVVASTSSLAPSTTPWRPCCTRYPRGRGRGRGGAGEWGSKGR